MKLTTAQLNAAGASQWFIRCTQWQAVHTNAAGSAKHHCKYVSNPNGLDMQLLADMFGPGTVRKPITECCVVRHVTSKAQTCGARALQRSHRAKQRTDIVQALIIPGERQQCARRDPVRSGSIGYTLCSPLDALRRLSMRSL